MPKSTTLQGNKLTLTIGGVDYYADLTTAQIENEDADTDVVTFADAATGGGRQYFFTISAIQSLDPQSFWRMVWNNTGNTVAYRYAPFQNATPSDSQPHFTGQLILGDPGTIGGDADSSASSAYTADFRCDVIGKPTLDNGSNGTPNAVAATPSGAAVGSPVIVSGSRFNGTTGVKFGTTVAKFVLISDGTISTVVPAGITGATTIVVTNASGAGTALAYTAA